MRRRPSRDQVKADNQWMLPYWLPTQRQFLKGRPFGQVVPATARTRLNKLFAHRGMRFPDGYRRRRRTLDRGMAQR